MTTFSHMSAILSAPSTTPTTNLWQRFFSLSSTTAGIIIFRSHHWSRWTWVGSVTHWKTLLGERRDYFLIFSSTVPMPRCSFQVLQYALCLTERDRSVSGFPIISGCSLPQCQQTEPSFLSVCRSWWWIIKGPALPENTDVSTHTHTRTPRLFRTGWCSTLWKSLSRLRYSRRNTRT